MNVICLYCFTRYDKSYITLLNSSIAEEFRFEQPCVMDGCSGHVAELDELITPAIILLNQKGYATRYCCSGHIVRNYSNFYVSLISEGIDDEIFDNLPEGFYVDEGQNEDLINIRHDIDSEPEYNGMESFQDKLKLSRFEKVVDINRSFLEWVEQLPENEPIF